MRLNAVNTKHFTAEYWTVTNSQDQDTGSFVPIFGYDRTVRCSLVFDNSYSFAEVVSSEVLKIGSHLRNIKDRNGDPVIGSDYAYEVGAVAPVVNVFGFAEEYRYRVTRKFVV